MTLVQRTILDEDDYFRLRNFLRADQITAETPIIFLTALGESYTELQHLDALLEDYLMKPFTPQDLSAKVDRFIQADS